MALSVLHSALIQPWGKMYQMGQSLNLASVITNCFTLQGCPAVFALPAKPLTEAIRQYPAIRGINVGGAQQEMSFYKDDGLLYVSETPIPHFSLFGSFSE